MKKTIFSFLLLASITHPSHGMYSKPDDDLSSEPYEQIARSYSDLCKKEFNVDHNLSIDIFGLARYGYHVKISFLEKDLAELMQGISCTAKSNECIVCEHKILASPNKLLDLARKIQLFLYSKKNPFTTNVQEDSKTFLLIISSLLNSEDLLF